MKDIAERAGCSRSAVSKALRNAPDISEARRREIQALARDMGYRPHPMVSALMASRASAQNAESDLKANLAMVTASSDIDLRASINEREELEGAFERARESGFSVEFFVLDPQQGYSAERLHQIFSARGIQGMILLPLLCYQELMQLPFEEYTTVAIGTRAAEYGIPHAATNRFDNMVMALERLQKLGYTRPGLVLSELTEMASHLQYHGAYCAFAETRRQIRKLPVLILKKANPQSAFDHWINRHEPDVIVADIEIASLIRAAKRRIPDDVAFAVIDHKPSHKGMAGFNSNLRDVGAAAVDMLIGRLYRNVRGLPVHTQSLLINGSWVEGASAPCLSTVKTGKS